MLKRDSIPPGDIARIVHATTVFTNTLIERKGAKTGLITTEGFRDVLEIGRERKYELYDIFIQMPVPLVPRHLRREVPERLSEKGEVEVPLDETALMREVDEPLQILTIKSIRVKERPMEFRSASGEGLKLYRYFALIMDFRSRRRMEMGPTKGLASFMKENCLEKIFPPVIGKAKHLTLNVVGSTLR